LFTLRPEELTAIIHLRKPTYDLPFLWHLSKDVHRAVETVNALPRFHYLQTLFGNNKNPAAARLHYALASIEDEILTDMMKEVMKIKSAVINTLMFDGMIVFVRDEEEVQVPDVLAVVAGRWKVSFSMDKW